MACAKVYIYSNFIITIRIKRIFTAQTGKTTLPIIFDHAM